MNEPAIELPAEESPRPGESGDAAFVRHRGLVFALAYDITGSIADAEDVAQSAYERWHRAGGGGIREPKAWLARVATNLAIDKVRARREVAYPGPWLPEPLLGEWEAAESGEDVAVRAEEVSIALLVVLESLSPLERAAFLLVDVFAFRTEEAAAILERTAVATRQLLSRARKHLKQARPRQLVEPAEHREAVARFLKAAGSGDLTALGELLGEDVVLYADGGGVVRAALRPISGRAKVLRFLLGLAGQHAGRFRLHPRLVNGTPGWVLVLDGVLDQVVACDVEDGVITRLYVQRNPHKLPRDPASP